MAKSIKVDVNSKVLVWAREQSSYTIEEIAQKLKVKVQQIQNWESGNDQPSIAQLRKISNAYKFPISVFFLSVVPNNFDVMRDFRKLPDLVSEQFSPRLQLEIRKVQQRREIALELLDTIETKPQEFSTQISMSDNIEAKSLEIRQFLNLDIDIQKSWKEPRVAFNNIKMLIEEKDILVFQVDKVEVAEMRGFAIAEKILPVIAINRKDAYNGRIFSLLHEFVHILLGQGGISNASYYDDDLDKVEIFCNKLAAEILVPKSYILKNPIVKTGIQSYSSEELSSLAKLFSVSDEVILRRLLTLNKISSNFYKQKRRELLEQYSRNPSVDYTNYKRNIPRETITGLGEPYIHLAIENYNADKITLNDLSDILGGIKIKHIRKIGQELGGLYV